MNSPSILMILAATIATVTQGVETTLEGHAAKREALKSKIYAATGGALERPAKVGGVFSFINMQKTVPMTEIAEPALTMRRILQHDVNLIQAKETDVFSVQAASLLLSTYNTKGAVFLAEDSSLPSVLVAPESCWGMINLAVLKSDNPDALVLAQRVRREMWRVFAMVNGGSNTRMGKCVMQSVFSPKDIDSLGAEAFCPEPVNSIVAHLDRMGVAKHSRTTYKQACIEGWAPAPTNDVQRKIWNQVHEIPTNPLKISFDPKTDTK